MTRSPSPEIVRRALLRHTSAGESDAALLARYVADRDDEAFTELVRRYAPLVWGACRRACADPHAAEDAFQATFLALARQAASLRRTESLPGWLHAVARRMAARARTANKTHDAIPQRTSGAPSPAEEASANELLAAIEEEIDRLPVRYRSALILCWFEDGPVGESARRLGVSPGVLSGRLKRARDRLRRRLAARGFGPMAILAAAVLTSTPAPAALLRRTTLSALQVSAQSAGAAPRALGLKLAAALAFAAAVVAGGTSVFSTDPPKPPKDPPKKEAAAEVAVSDGFTLPPSAVQRFGNRQLRHPEAISASAISPDGKYLATASRWAVIVWDLKTLSAKRVLTEVRFLQHGSADRGANLAFLPDSSALIVAVRPPERIGMQQANVPVEVAQAWDLETGKLKYAIKGPANYNSAVWVTAGGKEVAAILGNRAIVFHDAKDGKELRKVDIPQLFGNPWIADDGETIAYQGADARGLIALNVKDGKERFRIGDGTIIQAAFTNDGRILAYLDQQKKIRLRDLKTEKDLIEFTHPAEQANVPMRLSADGKTLYFGSEHGHLYRWDLVANRAIPGLGRHTFWTLTGLQISPDESTLYTMGWNKVIKRWDLKTGQEMQLPPGYHTQAFMEVAVDGQRLFVGDHATQLDEWDLATGKKVRALNPESNGGINTVAQSPDGKWLAVGRVVQDVQLWDVATGKLVREIPLVDKPDRNGGDQVQRVAFSPDSKIVYSLSPKTGTTAWNVATGEKAWNNSTRYPQLAVDPKGRWVITAGGHQNPPAPWAVLDAATGKVVAQFAPKGLLVDGQPALVRGVPATSYILFTPDGSQILSGHHDGTVRVWNAETRSEVRHIKIGNRDPVSIACSPDGKWLGVGGPESGVSVWELATGKAVASFPGHQSWVSQVAFTRDGRGLLSNADLAPLLWDLCPKDLPTDGLWEALASDDALKAYKAQWALIRDPSAAIKLFDAQVKLDDLGVKRGQFDKWVTDLDSAQFRVRESAEKELRTAGGKVPIEWVRKALADSKSDEPRARLTRILAQRENTIDPNALRLARAVQVLELARTAETKAKLQAWAKVEGSPLAEEAGEALRRATKR